MRLVLLAPKKHSVTVYQVWSRWVICQAKFTIGGASGVSADGSVVVGQSSSSFGYEAFRWTQSGGMAGLGDLPGGNFSSIAMDVSGDGLSVVGYGTTSTIEAFYWREEIGMVNLQQWLINHGVANMTGWSLTSAQAISSDGTQIVGYGVNPQGQTEAFLATVVVPEASTFAMITLAAFVLAVPRRRQSAVLFRAASRKDR
ncbi:MAG: hypothetical protein U1D30_21930 [Planctomycetota bacterium]